MKRGFFLLLICTPIQLVGMDDSRVRATDSSGYQVLASPSFSRMTHTLKLEADHLLELALAGTSADAIPQNQKKAVLEIQTILGEKKYLQNGEVSSNASVSRAVEIYKGALTARSTLNRSQNLIAKALYAQPGSLSSAQEEPEVIEVRKAVRARVVNNSQSQEVREAVNLYRRQEGKKTKLFQYCIEGTVSQIQRIIDSGITATDLDTKDSSGNTALALTVIHKKPRALQMLLEAGANANTINDEGKSPLDIAHLQKHKEMIRLLKDAKVETGQNLSEKQAIFDAVKLGDTEKLRKLLKVFSPNIIDRNGGSLVAFAVRCKKKTIVKMLVEEYKVYLNRPSNTQETPLDIGADDPELSAYLKQCGALTYEQYKTIEFFFQMIEQGDEIALKGILGREVEGNPGLKERLLNATNNQSNTLLIFAALKGRKKWVTYLVEECDAEKNIANNSGMTALDCAYEAGLIEIVAYLESKGALGYHKMSRQLNSELQPAEVHSQVIIRHAGADSKGSIAAEEQQQGNLALKMTVEKERKKDGADLLIYAQRGDMNELAKIVEKGISDSPRNEGGESALHLAAAQGHYEAVMLLLDEGADCNVIDNLGRSVLDVANPALEKLSSLLTARGALRGEDIRKKRTLFALAKAGKTSELQKTLTQDFTHIRDAAGDTLLAVAAAHAHLATVKMLTENFRMDVNAYNLQKQTVYDLGGKFELVAPYLELQGALTFDQLQDRLQLLNYARRGDLDGMKKMVAILKTNGLLMRFLHVQDGTTGDTLLITAARASQVAFAKYLVEELKIEVAQRNYKSESAYEIAGTVGCKPIADLVLRHMKKSPSLARTVSLTDTKKLTRASSDGKIGRTFKAAMGVLPVTFLTRLKEAKPEEKKQTPHIIPAMSDAQQKEFLERFMQHGKDISEAIEKGINIHKYRDNKGNSILALAVLRSNLDLVESALQHEVDPNVLNNDNLTPFDQAKFINHDKIKLTLIKFDALTGTAVLARRRAFAFASQGKISELKALLGPDVPCNIVDSDGNSLVALAACNGHAGIVEFLIKDGNTKVNVVNIKNETALDLSASYPSIYDYLKSQNALSYQHIEKIPLLLKYADQGQTQKFKDLIATMSVEITGEKLCNVKDKQNNTPLSVAAHRGWIELVTFLIEEYDVNVNTVVNEKTPLDLANLAGHRAVVQRLEKAGAFKYLALQDLQQNSGAKQAEKGRIKIDEAPRLAIKEKSLMGDMRPARIQKSYSADAARAVSTQLPVSFVKPSEFILKDLQLLASYASLGKTNELVQFLKNNNLSSDTLIDGETLLARAINNGHIDTARALVDQCNEEVNVVTKNGQTHLELAQNNGPFSRYLVSKGALSYKGLLEKLFVLISKGQPTRDGVSEFITKTRISPNAVDDDGRTALGEAVVQGNLGVVQLLVDTYQVPLDSLNKNWPVIGITPFEYASKNHQDLFFYLLEKMAKK